MTAAPPDPRGVAGLVGEAVECLSNCAEELDATGRHSSRIARAIDGLRSLQSALAASPVSQPTVGGEVVAFNSAADALREYADLQDMVNASGGTFPVRLNGAYASASLRKWADQMEAANVPAL